MIAEDDANFGMMLKIFLEMQDFQVMLCQNGQQALHALRGQAFDLCVLDVMMPVLDGFALAENLSKTQPETRFVFLTAKALKEDQLRGYQLGASDYLIKPFDPEILLVKIRLLLQKRLAATAPKVFRIGQYVFDPEKRYIVLEGKEQKLSPKESDLLWLLCEKNGGVLTHEEALMKVWGNDDYFTKQSMNVFVTKLRKMLSADPANLIQIENLHAKGFALKVQKK